jgi:hypothetical protein
LSNSFLSANLVPPGKAVDAYLFKPGIIVVIRSDGLSKVSPVLKSYDWCSRIIMLFRQILASNQATSAQPLEEQIRV